ncbi:hypothetical protein ABMA27_001811 [Loxostege sticticalis]|uniref:FP protein C-terminal domain-containing protein n=1 Tax=Loxostege sticticalis TaxID=481309 RepID=A0ABR3HVI0_LOXSC
MDKHNCVGCSGTLHGKEFMCCHDCKQKYDLQCASISPKRFKSFNQDKKRNWKCPECTCKQPKTDNRNTPVRSIPQLEKDVSIEELEEKSAPSPGCSNITIRKKSESIMLDTNYITMDGLRLLWTSEFKDEIKAMIDLSTRGVLQQLKAIDSRCSAFQESMTFVSKQYEDLKKEMSDLKKLFGNTTTELKCIKAENENLKKDLTACAARVKFLEEEYSKQQQWVRLQNLEIIGIPEQKDEIPTDIVRKLSEHLGATVEPSDIEFAHRVQPRRAISATKARPIVVRLRRRNVKDSLLAAARKYRGLTARDLGIGGEAHKIFINEHLTKDNKMLLSSCKQKSKEIGYKYVWTKNCRIFVRKSDTSPPIPIVSMADLVKIA